MNKQAARGQRWSWASFVDSLNPSVFVGLLQPDGTLVHANRAALDAAGVGLPDVCGTPFHQTPWWRHSQSARQRLLAAIEAARHGESSRFDAPFLAAEGQVWTVDFSLRPVMDEHGAVAFLVASACDVTARHRAQQQLSLVSESDTLTGLPNRVALRRRLADALQAAAPVAVLYLDIDRFGRIGAALGSSAGDAVLKTVAARIAERLPQDACVARLDSDEFVVTLERACAGGDGPARLSRTLLDAVSCPIAAAGQEVVVTASIGIALSAPGLDADALLRNAAVALDRARDQGRNRHVVHRDERGACDPRRFALEASLRQAIRRGELHLVYQPQVAVASGEIVAIEALLRWTHPRHGVVSPDVFIPIAEEGGLIGAIGDWVLTTACTTASAWQREGLPPVRMTVNVSASQLRGGELASRVAEVLAQTGLDPRRLGIELTESVLMQHLDDAALQLGRLRALGIEIALDDFGTGYSSLSYLRRLPLDAVKIDRSLVPAVTGNSDTLPITRAIIAMAHSLGMKVVAEGVETEGQLELLVANHCDDFQGYHFSAPATADDIGAMLRAGRRLPLLDRRRAARVRTVLVVDDDRWVVEKLKQQLPWRFGDTIRVEGFVEPRAALRRLRESPVDIVVSDLLMPGLDGVSLMTQARELQPNAVRMMLLGPADLARVIDDERQVDVFRYLSKPWMLEQLLKHFDAALERVDRLRGERILGDGIRANVDGPDTAVMEMLQLEEAEPGLTAVTRGPLDEMELPSQLMTMPGDLWTPRAKEPVPEIPHIERMRI